MATSEIPPNIAELTGPLFLGHLFNWGLFGALTVQVYIYYISFPNDKRLPKIIVSSCYILELLQTVLSTRDAFRNFGTGWGNMEDLDTVGWLWFSVPVLGSIICCMGQLFYTWRLYMLGRSWFITGIILTIALVQLGFGLYSGITAGIAGHFSGMQHHTFKYTAVWLSSAAVNDVLIAICMIWYLHRSNTGFRETSTLVTKFIRLSCETGLVCALFATLDCAFYVRWQNNNFHLAPSIPLSKMYSNSLLVVLNARIKIVGGRNEYKSNSSGFSGDLSYLDGTQSSTVPRFATQHNKSMISRLSRVVSGGDYPNNFSVSVSQEVHTSRDSARMAKQVHIPMVDIDESDGVDVDTSGDDHKHKFDGSPIDDVHISTVERVNKSAHLF
ncbi:hypothetical protein BDY19DRAFT_442111 [Irpex rosettiformis]|uniref:Uncharacterized protein n=1 Tax=Irpex rosettiformis TaxID=378272 RepID=A0ACB8TU74_9APHY|nr:hypothetical protein BDY19DRAFT_442111 [Irpex rosettiformis]